MKRFNKLIEIGRALKPSIQDFRAFHVAGIYNGNRLISVGTNVKKTHPFAFKMGYPFAHEAVHAECLSVIRGRLENYTGHDLIVVRIGNDGNVNYSKPCKFCERMVGIMCFDNIYYSGREGEMIKL